MSTADETTPEIDPRVADRFQLKAIVEACRGMEEKLGKGELGAKTGKGFYEHG
jgi:hypothetical protein